MRTLIIGCGNADRGDDAAGVLVARKLRAEGFPTLERCGEATSLIESWLGIENVILVDAVITGSEPGTILSWDARTQRLSRAAFRCSTHTFSVADAIELARILDRLPPRVFIYGIEAAQFAAGTRPSPAVLEAVERLAEQIAHEVSGYARVV